MKRETMLLVGAVLLAVACGGDAPPATDEASAWGPGPASTGGGMGDASRFEVMWMTQMIDHHQMAVEMALLCDGRALHPELLQLCLDVEATQKSEICSMKGWLCDWYGIACVQGECDPMADVTGAGTGGMGMMRDGDELASSTGAQFETEWMLEMIPHHAQAVHMSQACVARAEHDELGALCESIIVSQSAEIASMQTWLCDWYDICDAFAGMAGGGSAPGPGGTGDRSCGGTGPYAGCPGDGGGMGPGGSGSGSGPGPMHGGGMGGHR